MIRRFLQNLDLYILPVLNVDGYIYSWEAVSSENPGLDRNLDVHNMFCSF